MLPDDSDWCPATSTEVSRSHIKQILSSPSIYCKKETSSTCMNVRMHTHDATSKRKEHWRKMYDVWPVASPSTTESWFLLTHLTMCFENGRNPFIYLMLPALNKLLRTYMCMHTHTHIHTISTFTPTSLHVSTENRYRHVLKIHVCMLLCMFESRHNYYTCISFSGKIKQGRWQQ